MDFFLPLLSNLENPLSSFCHMCGLPFRDISGLLQSVNQFSCSVVSDSLQPHESQHKLTKVVLETFQDCYNNLTYREITVNCKNRLNLDSMYFLLNVPTDSKTFHGYGNSQWSSPVVVNMY